MESNHRRRGYEPRALREKALKSLEKIEPGPIDEAKRARKAAKMRAYRHGLAQMKAGISKLGSRALDKRYRVSRALAQWRRDLVADLGGEENISTQQLTLIELASTSKLLLGSIDAWLLSQPSLFQRNKTLFPVVLQRQTLANALAQHLKDLGLERRHKVKTLNEILAKEDDTLAKALRMEGRTNERRPSLSRD